MEDKLLWVALSYTLPITPSGSRVYVWRKLRELGAGALRQGTAILPESRTNIQRLRELSVKIHQLKGEATLVQMRFLDDKDAQQMVESFKRQSAQEYRQLLLETAKLYELPENYPDRGRRNAIRKRYRQACGRDYFGAQEELSASEQVGQLLKSLELDLDGGWGMLVGEFRQGLAQLSRMMTGREEPDKDDQDEQEEG